MTRADRRTIFALVVVITLLGLALRLYRLSNQSLWMDEISSVETARVPLDQIVERSAQNNASPAYFLLLRPIVGKSNRHIEAKARLLSAIAGALSIPVFIGVVLHWRKEWSIALVAGVLLAINPLHLWYSQEARGYAIMLFFGLWALLSLEWSRPHEIESEHQPGEENDLASSSVALPFVPRGTKGGQDSDARLRFPLSVAYALFAILASALHKIGLVFPLTCALWDVALVIRHRRRFGFLAPHLTLVAIAGLLLFQPSRPPATEYGRPTSVLEILYTAMTFVGGYSFGPSVTDIQNVGAKAAVLGHSIQTGLIGLVLLLAVALCFRRRQLLLPGKEGLLIVLGIGLIVVGGLISHFPFNVRYALPALLGFLALMAAVTVSRLESPPTQSSPGEERRMRVGMASNADKTDSNIQSRKSSSAEITARNLLPNTVAAALIVLSLWADGQWFFAASYRKGDSRAVAQWLIEHSQQAKSWTVLPDYLGYSVKWYLAAHPEIVSGYVPPTSAQTTSFPPVPDVLIIGRRHHLLEPDKLIESYGSAAGQVQQIKSIAGFELYVRQTTP